jgi:hypothetical protein
MEEENTQAQEGQDSEPTDEGSPVPDPEQNGGSGAEDVPEAD